jgi:hypothetical protein
VSSPARELPGLQGGIVWALVPYDFAAPFEVAGTRYDDVRALAADVRNRELRPEFSVQVGAKIRPVLLMQDRPQGRIKEYAALKLTRLEKLDEDVRQQVIAQRLPRFFHITDPRRYGLGEDVAVDLLSLVRLHESAIVAAPAGKLNENEFRVVCERLVRSLDLDLAHMVVQEAAAFLDRQGLT